MRSVFFPATMLIVGLGLAACSKPVTDADTAAATSPATPAAPAAQVPAAPAATPIAGANGLLKASNGTASCEAGSDVQFSWDLTSKPDVQAAEVWVGEGPEAKLFTAGGPQGAESTGPWVKPATVFVLRNAATKQELDRVVIQGPACPPEAAPGA